MTDEITRSAERRIKELEGEVALANKQRDDALVRAVEDQDEHSEQRAKLAAELERMRPVVEAACIWRHYDGMGYASKLGAAVDAYESATATPSTVDQAESQENLK